MECPRRVKIYPVVEFLIINNVDAMRTVVGEGEFLTGIDARFLGKFAFSLAQCV